MSVDTNIEDEFEYFFELLKRISEKEFHHFSSKPFTSRCECGGKVGMQSRLCFNHNNYKFICFFIPMINNAPNSFSGHIRFDIELIRHSCKNRTTMALTHKVFDDVKETPQYEKLKHIFKKLRKKNQHRMIDFLEQTLICHN